MCPGPRLAYLHEKLSWNVEKLGKAHKISLSSLDPLLFLPREFSIILILLTELAQKTANWI